MERQPSYTSEESSPFASVPTASGNAVRSLLNENTTAADDFAVTLLGQEGVSKKLRTEDDAVTRTVQARQDTVRTAFNSGTMRPQDFAREGREAGLSCGEVAGALRARIAGACGDLFTAPSPPERPRLNLRVVLISDTHGHHRKLGELPPGDVLIHAGDFTHCGRESDARDFNAWLAEQPHAHRFVVVGNHEADADWRRSAATILSNATLLSDEVGSVPASSSAAASSDGADASCSAAAAAGPDGAAPEGSSRGGGGGKGALTLWGTDFYWPMKTPNPHYADIPDGVDVVVAHGPAMGHVDGGAGCEALLRACARVRPRLVVSGHIHGAHGMCEGRGALHGTTFVNAANARKGHGDMGWPVVVVDL